MKRILLATLLFTLNASAYDDDIFGVPEGYNETGLADGSYLADSLNLCDQYVSVRENRIFISSCNQSLTFACHGSEHDRRCKIVKEESDGVACDKLTLRVIAPDRYRLNDGCARWAITFFRGW